MKCSMLIKNCSLLTDEFEIVEDRAIAIQGQHIAAVCEDAHEWQAEETIDGAGLLWMPALTDAHTHTCQQLLKGRILDELPMIWTRIMLPFESTLTPQDVTLSAQLAAVEMIRNGTGSFIDAGGVHMERAAEVYLQAGLRGAITCSTMDVTNSVTNLPGAMFTDTQRAVEQLNELYDAYHGQGDGRLSVFYSLRSLLSCSEKLILEVFDAAGQRDAGVVCHTNEYPAEVNYFLQEHRLRPTEYLEALGVLSPSYVSVHTLFVSESEIDLIQKRGVKVVHCPFSNCGKALPKTPRLLQSGIDVAIGTDGAGHGGLSMFQEMKILRSTMNVVYGTHYCEPDIMPAAEILRMALQGGAACLMQKEALGAIAPGHLADLIAVDSNSINIFPSNNLVNSLVESASGGDVKHMIIDGKWVMKNRQLLTLDEDRILHDAKAYMKRRPRV